VDFDTLIWIVVFVIWAISSIWKKLKTAPKTNGAPPKKRPGWKEKLDQVLSQVQKELEASKRQDAREGTGWERVLPRGAGETETGAEEFYTSDARVSEPADEIDFEDELVLEEVRPVERLVSIPEERPVRIKPVVDPSIPVAFKKKVRIALAETSAQDLQKAFVWAEILAPPLALRK